MAPLISLACGILALIGAANSVSDQSFGAKLLRSLDIPVVGCPPEAETLYGDHVNVACGTTDHNRKSFKKTWRKATRLGGALNGTVGREDEPWFDTAPSELTLFDTVLSTLVAIVVSEVTGTVRVHWVDHYPGCHAGIPLEFYEASRLRPAQELYDLQEYQPSRSDPRDDGSAAIGSYVVDANGLVADICIVAITPATEHARQDTVAFLSGSKFRPATYNGNPVVVAIKFGVSSRPRGDRMSVAAMLRDYFDAQRLSDPRTH